MTIEEQVQADFLAVRGIAKADQGRFYVWLAQRDFKNNLPSRMHMPDAYTNEYGDLYAAAECSANQGES